MAVSIFRLPDLGEGLTEADVVEWYVAEGESVALDQLVVALESARAVVDIPSPVAGRVRRHCARPGETVATGAPLVEFEVDGEIAADAAGDIRDAGAAPPGPAVGSRRGRPPGAQPLPAPARRRGRGVGRTRATAGRVARSAPSGVTRRRSQSSASSPGTKDSGTGRWKSAAMLDRHREGQPAPRNGAAQLVRLQRRM